MKTSFTVRALTLTGIIVSILLLSNGLLLAVASYSGVPISNEEDLFSLLNNENYSWVVKSFIGLNHFMTFILAPILFLSIFYRHKIIKYLRFGHFNPALLLWFPLALLMLYPLMGWIANHVSKIDLPDFFSSMDEDSMATLAALLKMDNLGDLFINLFLIAILPGIGEELLFRGVIQTEIMKKWRNPHIAIWVTAIIFGAFHFQIVGLIPKMMIGAVLGYAYYYSGSLVLPMIMHALNNGFAAVAYYVTGEEAMAQPEIPQDVPIIPVLVTTLMFVLIMKHIQKICSPVQPLTDV